MALYFNPDGTLREPQSITLNVGGVLKTCTEVWTNDEGTLKKIWPCGVFTNDRANFNAGIFNTTTYTQPQYYGWYSDTTASYSSTNFEGTAAYGRGTVPDLGIIWSGTQHVWFLSKTQTDLTPYSTLTVSFTYRTAPNSNSYSPYLRLYFLAHTSNTLQTTSDWSVPAVTRIKIIDNIQSYTQNDSYTDYTVNISSATGLKYFGLEIDVTQADSPSNGTAWAKFTKFELS